MKKRLFDADRFSYRVPFYSRDGSFAGYEYRQVDVYTTEILADEWEDWVRENDKLVAGDKHACTCMSDKHGNIIYEHDIIKSPNNSNLLVVLSSPSGAWETYEYAELDDGTLGVRNQELDLSRLVDAYDIEIVSTLEYMEAKHQ